MIFAATTRRKRNRAFTLIELLVVLVIIGAMAAVGVVSVSAGKGAARVKGATRDIYAAIRHARSTALVTGQRVLVTYSNGRVDDEPVAQVKVVAARIMGEDPGGADAQPYYVTEYARLPSRQMPQDGTATNGLDGAGESVEEILFAPMGEEVAKGMRIKVVKGDAPSGDETDVQTKSRISIFSNIDYLIGRYRESVAKEEKSAEGVTDRSDGGKDGTSAAESSDDMTEPVSVVWETNGAVEAHDVWIYADGRKPEDGLLLRIDRFGAVRVLTGDGREDD